MPVNYSYVDDTRPIRLAKVSNPRGFWDLVVAKNKKSTAIRISTRTGSAAVNIAVSEVDNLIKALQDVKSKGVGVSTSDSDYRTATGA